MPDDDPIGAFQVRTFPRTRVATLDTLRWGRRRHHVPMFFTLDVTEARAAIRQQRTRAGEGMSFTSWIVQCVAQAVRDHPDVHAMRKGRRRVVVFDEVDVALVVERREAGAAADAATLPMPYVIRRADRKTPAEIHGEIRAAQCAPVGAGEVQIGSARDARRTKLFAALPRVVRDALVWRRLFRNPFFAKRTMGTVAVTALGMAGPSGLSWGVPVGIHPLIVGVGGVERRPALTRAGEGVVLREYVGITVVFDHAVTDGAPVARFAKRLQQLSRQAHGLEPPGAAETQPPDDED